MLGTASSDPQRNHRAAESRRLPVGAEVLDAGGVHFRVWAPRCRAVDVVIEGEHHPLALEGGGYFAGTIASARAGTRYRYRLDGAEAYPDPASRFQPEGPHGPSEVIDPAFDWSDAGWKGPRLEGAVLYEMHVGTFTHEGTWAAAARQLPALAGIGISVIEVMPVAEFAGRFGWGYDGVDLFAPMHRYGRPDDLRRFVDRAHGLGIGVLLDVVYNHLGPDGNYLGKFSDHYFSRRYRTDWGDAFNFDEEQCAPVRELITSNACHWVREYHLDGLRLDATQSMFDSSPRHVLVDIRSAVAEGADGRRTIVVGENEPQDAGLVRPVEDDGCGLDALWNDDFHHAAMVALTGRDEAYYTDYRGHAQEFVSAAKRGFLYQGQWYRWQLKRRGTPTRGVPLRRFVHFLENHDQVANSATGRRVHQLTSPGRHRAFTALLLLGPQTPMLFQGQEFSASSPFLYFADHEGKLAELVRTGRGDFLAQFPSIAQAEVRARLDDPGDPTTFERCRLDHGEREAHPEAVALHRDLIRLRRDDPVISRQGADGIDGAVVGDSAFVLRWFTPDGSDDRLLVVNFGPTLRLSRASEPLLAPPARSAWHVAWSSDDPHYGGPGTAPIESERRMQGETGGGSAAPLHDDRPVWHLPGECSVLLTPSHVHA